MLDSHGLMQKSVWLEESVGVPFLLRWPGCVKPHETPLLFNSVDVIPTLLGLMGIAAFPDLDGRDLSELIQTESRGDMVGRPHKAFLAYYGMRRRMVDPQGGWPCAPRHTVLC